MSIVVPVAHATQIGGAFTQYQGTFCGVDPNGVQWAPAWLCTVTGATGAANFLAVVGAYIMGIAAAIGVCVFIYACIRMIMSQGQEDKVSAAKKMAVTVLAGVFLVLFIGVIIPILVNLFTLIAPPQP